MLRAVFHRFQGEMQINLPPCVALKKARLWWANVLCGEGEREGGGSYAVNRFISEEVKVVRSSLM